VLVADETTTTYVESPLTGGWLTDTYDAGLAGFRAKSISKVSLILQLNDDGFTTGRTKGTFLINSTLYYGAEINATPSWVNYTQEWTTDPSTGQPWTAAAIRALQFGVSMYKCRCARVRLVIEYEPKVEIPTRGSAIWW